MKQTRVLDMVSRTNQAKKIHAVLEDYLGEKGLKKLKVLDVGCASGIIDAHLARYVYTLVGIDIDEEAIRFAKKNFQKNNLTFAVADGLTLPFADHSFDAVICHQVYEHVADSKKLFEEIYRVLAAGGLCYVAAMNKWFPWEPHVHLPFLSYFPKLLVHVQIRPKSYWELQKEVSEFTMVDYTQKILNNPKKYRYSIPNFVSIFAPLSPYISPTFVWVLQK